MTGLARGDRKQRDILGVDSINTMTPGGCNVDCKGNNLDRTSLLLMQYNYGRKISAAESQFLVQIPLQPDLLSASPMTEGMGK
ncbi:hypothetical protein VTL71DRAFT_11519 [Oculimacula yallundae]|uniref:Uncharacterized protein n=1 Tax=Oculimacula yallundae TaxID=86028 RepID=A0ABR4CQF0_9HELO